MDYSSHQSAGLEQYKKSEGQTGIKSASPHRLIQMLLEGAVEKLKLAKENMQQGDLVLKGNHISWAISIIDGLRMSLDRESGGEITENLDALYDYMGRRLIEANVNDDESIMDEIMGLLLEIKSAWDVVPELLAAE